MAPRIFLCYEAETSSIIGESIYNMLVSHFDPDIIIRETEHSDGEGSPLVTEPSKGDVLIVVLHPQWLRFTQEGGTSLLDWNRNFLSRCYLKGLSQTQINTILVLADGAKPPSRLKLPSNLQHMPNYDMTSLAFTQKTLEHDANRLLHIIRTRAAKANRNLWPVALVGILVLTAAACLAVVPFGKISLLVEGVIPGRASGYVNEGWREYQNGNYEDAVAKFEHSSLIAPSADAYEGLAWSYAKLNQPEQAVASFDQLVELTSGSDRGYGQRGWYYIGVKDFENALPDMEQAILLNSADADNYYGLGLAQDGLGNITAALEAYQQYLNLASTPDSYVANRVQELEQPARSP